MKEILIVSGKGGTGKTSITAALASLAKDSVFADCDVDAADLHLILNPEVKTKNDFISGHEAVLRLNDCIGCGECIESCRYDAISSSDDDKVIIDPVACEGCGVCVWSCPVGAIDFPESFCGHYFRSETRFGPMVHAKLAVAAENSGKLVSMVRREATRVADEENKPIVLIDGPPGIGCPVIASMTGVNVVLLVTEPTLSGLHDMERVINLTKHFGIEVYVCINKYDVNSDIAKVIEEKMEALDIPIIGRILYDNDITYAQIARKSIVEYSDGVAAKEITMMWDKIKEIIK
jgi:MinD superfamily P-loop ATPase